MATRTKGAVKSAIRSPLPTSDMSDTRPPAVPVEAIWFRCIIGPSSSATVRRAGSMEEGPMDPLWSSA